MNNNNVAVIGLGFVGLPLSILFSKKGYKVYGFDTDATKVDRLNNGRSYITDVLDTDILYVKEKLGFQAFLPSAKIQKASTIVVTVPTPYDEKKLEPDLSAIIHASNYIAKHLVPKQTIIFESSTYPGTLEEVVLPILKTSGLKVGTDFYLGYSPERIDPGNQSFSVEQIPKVVSGVTENCKIHVTDFYQKVFTKVVPVSSPKIAEMTKLFENIQRLVNISLVNEIQLICEKMGIDIREVIQAAATKPFGFTPYYPGPGIGGHCIPVDPLYFQWKAAQFGLTSELIHTAHQINKDVPLEIVKKTKDTLSLKHNDAKSVFIIGLTYKKDVGDLRESPALLIFEQLLKDGLQVQYHDPFVPSVTFRNQTYYSLPLNPENIHASNLVLILTDHSSINWKMIIDHASFIIDTRGVTRNSEKGV